MVFYVLLSSSIFLFITHVSINFFSNMLYIYKDNIHHFSHKWALKWQQFIYTRSLKSNSAKIGAFILYNN